MKQFVFGMVGALALGACTFAPFQEKAPQAALGDFALGHNIVIAPNPHQGPGSRDATPEELIEAVQSAIAARFEPYEGDKLYNFGVSVDGYSLADTGVPVVLSPKSALILHITVWDDAAGEKLNEEAYQLIVVEELNAKSVFGSGFFNTREQQLAQLAERAAEKLESWLEEHNAWFGVDVTPE